MQSRRDFLERSAAGAAFMLRELQTRVGSVFGSFAVPADTRSASTLPSRNRYYEGPLSDHFDGTRFFNPGQPSADKGLLDVFRWKLAAGAARWPKSVAVTPARPEKRIASLRVTMVGHASTLIQVAGVNILTDPVWSQRASPFTFVGPKRVTAPGIAFDDLPPIDAVLLSHCHYDHLDVATLRRLHAVHAPLMLMPLGNYTVVRAAVPGAKCVTGDWWDRLPLGAGMTTTLTPAHHWANRWPNDVRMTLWAGHYLSTPAGSIWFAGDTAYHDGELFKEIRNRLGPCDVALIPISAYKPRWFMKSQHIDPCEAVQVFQNVLAAYVLGIHWGTFQLTDEAREEPPYQPEASLASVGIQTARFTAVQPGSVYDF